MNDKRGIKPLPELHITLKFNHDGTFAGAAGWSWRNGRCSRNGMVVDSNENIATLEALDRAIAAYEQWLDDGGDRVVD